MSERPKSLVMKRFEEETATRYAAGLPQEQAKLIALFQLTRDARNGSLPADAVADLIIAEEMRHGRASDAAKEHARAVLAGKSSDYAPRDFGYPKGRQRRHSSGRVPLDASNCDPFMSDSLTRWVNGGCR